MRNLRSIYLGVENADRRRNYENTLNTNTHCVRVRRSTEQLREDTASESAQDR